MRFFDNDQEIFFERFKEILPEEASVLREHLGIEADFEIDKNSKLYLRSSFSGPISFKPRRDLEYHRNFFHKNSVYTQPLARALGIKKGENGKARPKVLDASAGTLKDGLLMVSMGCEVVAAERSPVAQALIINALKQGEVAGLEFVPCDAIELMGQRQDFDVIYFDPMYEQKNEKAAPRKEMRIFREVVKPDVDAKENARLFKESGKRLVIKRSSKAAPLLENPDVSFGQKSTVYDVYLVRQSS